MPAPNPSLRRPKPTAGSRVGNGAAILGDVDGRSAGARRYRELAAGLADHLGEPPTAPQEALIRRAAQLAAWCEAREADFARSGELDIAAFTTAANSLRRLLGDLGLERRMRDVTPSLGDYIKARGHD